MHVRREADIGTFTIQKWEKEGRQLSTCPQRKPCRSFLRRVGWGTDLCARIPFSFFFLTSQRLRFHLPLHTHPSIYRYLYFKLFAKLQQMGASRSGHFPTHHQRKAPPPLFFFLPKIHPGPAYDCFPQFFIFKKCLEANRKVYQQRSFSSQSYIWPGDSVPPNCALPRRPPPSVSPPS